MQTNPDQTGALTAFQQLVERELLLDVFEHAPTQVFVVDGSSLHFVAANAAARKNIAASLPRLQQMQLHELLYGIDKQRIHRLLNGIRRRRTHRASFSIAIDDAMDIRLEISMLFSDKARPSFLIFVGDVSASQRKTALATRMLETAIEALSDGFVLYDADDRLVICNRRYRELYRDSAALMVPGKKFEDILRLGLMNGQYADAIGREDEWLRERLRLHQEMDQVVEQQLSNGRWLQIVERRTSDGGRVGLRVDITTIKQQQQALDNLSRTDDLTGLLNRRGLTTRLEELRNDLRKGQRLVMLQIDLDRFKKVNDLFGHEAGDKVLQHCGTAMSKSLLRPIAAARVGGDEFILVLRTRRSNASLLSGARRLIQRLSDPILIAGHSITVGASVGLAMLRADLPDPVEDMIVGADIALNLVKQRRGNDAILFEQSMRDENLRRGKMAEQILLGLARREFEPFFQPQIDTQTGNVIGFEALIRWRHPVDGLVPAFQFLEVAQRAGLTEAIDEIVMDRSSFAARQLLDWGMKKPRISINMSIAQISDPTIVSRLETHMKTHNITSDNLRIELLESTLLDKQSSQIVRNVHSLIAAGFPVELDDFGTGHAAIATLRKFAVSCIKIDRSLVQNIDSDGELQVITAAIINLAKRLGIGVLAEGVETNTEQATLIEMGCHRAQGYLHAKPMPLEHLRGYLKDMALVA